MSVIRVFAQNSGDWTIWIGLNDDPAPPAGHSFVIGTGLTRDEAIASALEDLDEARRAVQKLSVLAQVD